MVKFITRRYFAFFPHSRIQVPCCALVPRCSLAMLAVFLYCGVECVLASHVKPELGGGTFNLGYGLAEFRESLHVPVLGDRVESFQLCKNSTPEGGSGLVKSCLAVNAIGDVTAKNGSKNTTNDFFKVVYEKFKHRSATPFDWFWWFVILPL